MAEICLHTHSLFKAGDLIFTLHTVCITRKPKRVLNLSCTSWYSPSCPLLDCWVQKLNSNLLSVLQKNQGYSNGWAEQVFPEQVRAPWSVPRARPLEGEEQVGWVAESKESHDRK